ncbi:pyridoxal phosphate-dependent decarboxylase family protein [Phaeodactylibacter luteus]|uniref:Aspartate aminotransferase family protein n=1 Tax=Phaeodactylibacter luteus TaxID=1564516 RepID=A0A5C6RHU3_9BACT|nr:aspartate aminotransferase family protein [Phaeodactylibacter luteus]TXB61519.1 aspartate aminotransferase family protein [Phaeodactylibacter luteus]
MSQSQYHIPEKGRPAAELLREMESFKAGDAPWAAGRTWSMVYQVDEAHHELLRQASGAFLSESYINPFAFESLQRMEREVVGMTAGLLNGGAEAVGTMTSGGTESIFMSLYTYREWGRKHRKGREEVVVPATIHPAFEKAAYLLGLKLVKVPVGPGGAADLPGMEQKVGPKTLLMAVSAPSYPHGILDPVEQAGALAQQHQVPLHVDACIGGFMLPWVERLYPEKVPPWDFRVAGVTSISADTHKFAYGAKGSSVLLFRQMEYLRHQFFITTDWAGGIYASATLLGSRSGGPIAAAWAALNSLGQERYLSIAREIMDGVEEMKAGIAAIPELEILGEPCMNILAFTTRSNKPDIFVVGDQLEAKGWFVDRQQRPNCIHTTVMRHNLPVIAEYLRDLQEGVAFAKSNPGAKAKGNAALYGLMARIPFRGMVEQNVRQMFVDLYSRGEGAAAQVAEGEAGQAMPEPAAWMGWLNRFLSWLPGKRRP